MSRWVAAEVVHAGVLTLLALDEHQLERALSSGCRDDSELLKDLHTVVEPELLDDETVLDLEHRRAGEAERLAGRRRRGADGKVIEDDRPSVRAAALPLADDVVALGDEVRGAHATDSAGLGLEGLGA